MHVHVGTDVIEKDVTDLKESGTISLQEGIFSHSHTSMTLICVVMYNVVGTINNLVLLTEIGRGSFGIVYKAIWRGGLAAAKILPFQAESSILKEIEIMRYFKGINNMSKSFWPLAISCEAFLIHCVTCFN